jgi:hypothetical protein
MAMAWHKWLENEDLFYEGLLTSTELDATREDLFKGLARMKACRRAYCSLQGDEIEPQPQLRLVRWEGPIEASAPVTGHLRLL